MKHLFFSSGRMVVVVALVIAGLAVAAAAAVARGGSQRESAVTPMTGRYVGAAGPFSLRFEVADGGGRIEHLVTGYNPAANCGIPTASESETFPTLEVHDGAFKGATAFHAPSGITTTFELTGHFTTRTRAEGTLHGHLSIKGFAPCNNDEAFTATRR
jgi:hypothetical protein